MIILMFLLVLKTH